MNDSLHKRLLIERGLINTWSKRGRSSRPGEKHRVLCALLRVGLRLTGLRQRGEQNALKPVLRRIRLPYSNLPESFCGFTILHLTDLHADGVPGLAEAIRRCLRQVEVDLCVLTGDYRFDVGGPCQGIYPPMEHILGGVNARLGVVGILGNHDASEEIAALEQLGVKMLVNDAMELRRGEESVWIVGVDDPHYYGCDDLPHALREVPAEAFKVLLVHTPEIIPEAESSGVHLYLCGHTHGGQVCLPFIGPIITNANCARAYARGVWRYKNLQGYTNPGVGTSGVPVRFFCPPEIGLIELRCARHQGQATVHHRRKVVEQPASAPPPRLAAACSTAITIEG